MKAPDWENCTEEEAWKFVGWHLAKNGIQTILVGGAVAAIYSEGVYKSGDLDMVLKTYIDGKITEVMNRIGFFNQGGRHYIHPKCDKFVEFMFGPAGIGDDIKIKPDEKRLMDRSFTFLNMSFVGDVLASPPIRVTSDRDIDFSDAAESTDDELTRAKRVGRPRSSNAKQLIALRVSPEVPTLVKIAPRPPPDGLTATLR